MFDPDREEGRVPRLMVFPRTSECLMLYVPRGTVVTLPPLAAPFVAADIRGACRAGGLDVRVSEGVVGRWTESYVMLRKAERAERAQRQRLAEVAKTAALRARPQSGFAQARADAITRKHDVDEQIRTLKTEIGQAKATAFATGRYMPATEFRAKEQRLAALQAESLALQNRLGELREAEKKERGTVHRAAVETVAERFMKAAEMILPDDLFREIRQLAQSSLDDGGSNGTP